MTLSSSKLQVTGSNFVHSECILCLDNHGLINKQTDRYNKKNRNRDTLF